MPVYFRDDENSSARSRVEEHRCTIGGRWSQLATDINRSGQVVGASRTVAGDTHAFIWADGVMTDLGTLGATYSVAGSINDAGQVVGLSTTAAGRAHAFLWEDGGMIDLGTLGGLDSHAARINARGDVVGSAYTAGNVEHAFLWRRGVMTDLGVAPGMTTGTAVAFNGRGEVVVRNDGQEVGVRPRACGTTA